MKSLSGLTLSDRLKKSDVKMKNQKKDKYPKFLIYPLFTFFIYSHTPSEYNKLWEAYRNRLIKDSRARTYNGEFQSFYERNKKHVEDWLLRLTEEKYPTPLYWNDISGFIAIRIENPIEGFRVIGEVWAIKNRRFKRNRVFRFRYRITEIIDKRLLNNPHKFNNKFFKTVEKIIAKIDKEFLHKRRFYFSLEDNRMNWDLLKTANVAKLLKELDHDWIY